MNFWIADSGILPTSLFPLSVSSVPLWFILFLASEEGKNHRDTESTEGRKESSSIAARYLQMILNFFSRQPIRAR